VPLRVYLNESANTAIATGLQRRGVEAWSARDVGNRGLADEEQLQYATRERAVLFTHDDDFLRIAREWKRKGREHGGILFVHARRLSIGEAIYRVAEYAQALDPEDVNNQVLFL